MRAIKTLTRAAVLGLALAALPAQRASAQVVAEAECNPVISSCDRIDFTFDAATAGEFFSVIIRTSDPNFRFRDDNTDPVGGLPFQIGELYDVANNEFLVWDGAIDPFGAGQQWTSAPFNFATLPTDQFILSLYFTQAGTLDPTTFAFEAQGTDAAGNPIVGSGNVSVASTPTTVPEPGTVLLLATGMLGLGAVGIRRRRQGLAS